MPGAGQIVFGQVLKGFLIIAVEIITFPTLWGPLIVMLLAIIDGYKVGNKRRRTGSVGDWEFFPE
jgi:hypothetical protein